MIHQLGISDSGTVWWRNWNEGVLRHTGSTSDIVFTEEHSLRCVAVHVAKNCHGYHLQDVLGRHGVQLYGHQWCCVSIEKGCSELLLSSCVLSWSHKSEFLVLLTSSWVKCAISMKRKLQMIWWLALIQWQHSIQLPMPEFTVVNALDLVWIQSVCM